MNDDVKKLELRIEELENQLKGVGSQMASVDPEKMKIFNEVSMQLGFDPEKVCGVNECKVSIVCKVCQVCQVCQVCRVCTVCQVCKVCRVCACINECSCGPCMQGNYEVGSGRFDNLG